MAIDRYRHNEHRALVWSLASAARLGIPLSESARAYADETLGDTGARALDLARGLEQGLPLWQAIRQARLRVATPVRLAVRLGESLGMLGPAMKQQLDDSAEIDSALRNVIGRLFYLGNVVVIASGVVTFVMLKIVPVYEKMFSDFGIKLPAMTRFVIDASAGSSTLFVLTLVGSAPLLVLSTIVLGGAFIDHYRGSSREDRNHLERSGPVRMIWRVWRLLLGLWLFYLLFSCWPTFLALYLLAGLLFFLGWFPRDVPLIWRFFRRYDGALVMRGLALTVRRGLPLTEGLKLLATDYPIRHVARRLSVANSRIEQGEDWRQALVDAGLIGRTDAAVLAAAQRVDNLAWALEEMAESSLRRLIYRVQLLVQILFPIALLFIGVLTAMFAIGLFLPLVSLIQAMT
jgi:type II secretory pathway component PulF